MVRDLGWDAFQQALKSYTLTPRKLEERLLQEGLLGPNEDASGETVSLWRSGRKRPPFAWLPHISEELYGDPTRLARLMGMVPDTPRLGEVVHLIRRRADLQEEARKLQQIAESLHDDRLASLVSEVSRSGEFAVAIWPHRQGPPGHLLHVGDRLTLRRTDGGAIANWPEAWRPFAEALDRAGAVVSKVAPRWPTATDDEALVSEWSVPRFTRQAVPRRRSPLLHVRQVCLVAQTANAWAADTGAAVAQFLGYGLDSSRDLVREIYTGAKRGSPALPRRAAIHRNYLADPRERYVWYHHGFDDAPASLLPPVDRPWPSGLVVVILEESDALLKWRVENRRLNEPATLDELKARRAAMLEAFGRQLEVGDERVDRLHLLSVEKPDDVVGTEPLGDSMMTAALERAADVLERLLDHALLDGPELRRQIDRLTDTADETIDPVSLHNRRVLHHWALTHERLTFRS